MRKDCVSESVKHRGTRACCVPILTEVPFASLNVTKDRIRTEERLRIDRQEDRYLIRIELGRVYLQQAANVLRPVIPERQFVNKLVNMAQELCMRTKDRRWAAGRAARTAVRPWCTAVAAACRHQC